MDPLQAVTLMGAAGALLWVVKLIAIDEKLHTDSEVKGLKADKAALWAANRSLQRAVDASNTTMAEILKLLQDVESNGE